VPTNTWTIFTPPSPRAQVQSCPLRLAVSASHRHTGTEKRFSLGRSDGAQKHLDDSRSSALSVLPSQRHTVTHRHGALSSTSLRLAVSASHRHTQARSVELNESPSCRLSVTPSHTGTEKPRKGVELNESPSCRLMPRHTRGCAPQQQLLPDSRLERHRQIYVPRIGVQEHGASGDREVGRRCSEREIG
jgi:hypothetical protein